MPTQDGLRLNHLSHTKQVRPKLGHPYEQCAVTTAEPKTRWRLPQRDIELMSEKQVLGFKSPPRLEHIGDKHSERVQDRKHRFQ